MSEARNRRPTIVHRRRLVTRERLLRLPGERENALIRRLNVHLWMDLTPPTNLSDADEIVWCLVSPRREPTASGPPGRGESLAGRHSRVMSYALPLVFFVVLMAGYYRLLSRPMTRRGGAAVLMGIGSAL